MQLPQKRKTFLQFFFHFVNSDSILNIFIQTMILVADVYLTLRTPEHVVQ